MLIRVIYTGMCWMNFIFGFIRNFLGVRWGREKGMINCLEILENFCFRIFYDFIYSFNFFINFYVIKM